MGTGPVPAWAATAARLLGLCLPAAAAAAAAAPAGTAAAAAAAAAALPFFDAAAAAGGVWKTLTAKPSATAVPASGNWEEILPLGSGGCGWTAPSASPASMSFCWASPSGRPTIAGTVALPEPVTTTTSTTVPFLAFAPAAGLWSTTVPGFCLGSDLFVVLPSLSPILLRSFWAANALGCPLRLGTTVCLGSSMITTTTAAASKGATNDIHHG